MQPSWKKQNTLKANDILEELRRKSGKSESDSGSIVKKKIPSNFLDKLFQHSRNVAISAFKKQIWEGLPVKSNKRKIEAIDDVVSSKRASQTISNVQDNVASTGSAHGSAYRHDSASNSVATL